MILLEWSLRVKRDVAISLGGDGLNLLHQAFLEKGWISKESYVKKAVSGLAEAIIDLPRKPSFARGSGV